MIDLYTWRTPNGHKIAIMLEEIGLSYTVKSIDLQAGVQMSPDYLKISPNNKVPAIVDHDAKGGPLAIFESAAILIYLAEKTGYLLPATGSARYGVLQWLAWQVSAVGPMFGQFAHFSRLPEDQRSPLALARFAGEVARLLRVLDTRLDETEYLGGEDYSITDVATYPWVFIILKMARERLTEEVRDLPATARWLAAIGARPAVQRGMAVPG